MVSIHNLRAANHVIRTIIKVILPIHIIQCNQIDITKTVKIFELP